MINSKSSINHKATINININNVNLKRSFKKRKSYKSKTSIKCNKDIEEKLTEVRQIYNDRELNSFEYEDALKYDKRSYFQYYSSLLLTKHLILFTFCQSKDFNLKTLKLILLIISFSLYFAVNGLFFSDKTMHQIYKDKGAFNLIIQIQQILYSIIISGLINTILRQLSLSDYNLIRLKRIKNYNIASKESKDIKVCLCVKFIIFFIISLIFMSFFWYFISCFCAVFSNTQIILIKDTCLNLCLSMIYPFGLNLLPGFFRIPALRAKKG